MKKTLITFAILSSVFCSSAFAEKMRILLVNDDGCESIGTTSLQDKLVEKGYDVWLVAPSLNQSGVGTSVTFKPGYEFEVKKVAEKRYCFPGTPSDSVDFALTALMKDNPPDLVISGVNDGGNTGGAQLNSGTVSAAVRAVRSGYPAISASIGASFTKLSGDQDGLLSEAGQNVRKYWPDSINYVADLVDKIQVNKDKNNEVLPAGTGLGLNYPAVPKDEIQGIKIIENEPFPKPQYIFEILPNGNAIQKMDFSLMQPSEDNTATAWLNRKYVIYSIFKGNWNDMSTQSEYEKIFIQD